jgi:phosphopantothenate---cysteine ligase (CTP)
MNILITAGGTTEHIDRVRSITNTSTGMLGSLIARAFANLEGIDKIYYICGKKAILPQIEKAEIIYVDTVASLETAIKKLIREISFDIIVHSMAVSDYRVKSVTSASLLADSIKSKINSGSNFAQPLTEESALSLVANPETLMQEDGKISSSINDLILYMEKTPKIISLFQTLTPASTLVGFKLLDHVSAETLIDTAYTLLQCNKCSFVLANDLRDITGEQHIGYLVDENKNYTRFTTKAEIADAIAAAALQKRRKIR